METSLQMFNEHTRIINKDIAIYEDTEKGIMFALNLGHLLCRVDYLELDKSEFKVAKFQKKIEDKEYNEITIKRPFPKYEQTKREEDKYVIAEKELQVKQVWNVSNSAGAYNSFTTKEEALEYANKINENVLGYLN